ncbi:MAG: WS/DGAT/MGAT family O-acyltransferase [Burkholderiales bacterium]
MKHLSGLDSTFLYLETPETPMHVGGLNLFTLPDGYSGDFYEDVKAHVAGRMHLASVFTRKLALMPFELASPVWIEDDDIDLDYHVRRIVLPRPGTQAQLETYVGRLHSSLMDRSRPLWEFSVIEGLQDGRMAFYSKLHHAAIDGQAGVALANAILDVGPVPRTVKAPPRRPTGKYQLGVAELLGAALSNQVAQYAKLAKLLPAAAQALKAAAGRAIAERRAGRTATSGEKSSRNWQVGPRTPLNTAITNQRSYATLSLPFADIRRIGKPFEASVNDVVLAICSGALRRYLADLGGVPAKPLIAAVPVSLRAPGDTASNNQASMTLVNLNTHVADARERLDAILAATKQMKAQLANTKSLLPTDFPTFGAPWLMSGVASLYGRSKLADRIPPFANVTISNVPGPQFPLYLAGARMSAYYPVSIVVHGVALNITVQSYNGSLDFGFTACRRALPDVRDLAVHTRESFDELLAIAANAHALTEAEEAQAAAAVKKPARARAAPAKTMGARGKAAPAPTKAAGKKSVPRKRVAGKLAGKMVAPVRRRGGSRTAAL